MSLRLFGILLGVGRCFRDEWVQRMLWRLWRWRGLRQYVRDNGGGLHLSKSAKGWKATIAYDFSGLEIDGLSIEYDFGNFKSDIDHEAGEHNLIVTYAPSNDWNIGRFQKI